MSFNAGRGYAAISLALALVAAPVAVHAQVGYDFNLPAQALAESLREVGRRAHVNIVFDPATVRGQNAVALNGTYSAQQALDRLLANTGLVLRKTQGGSFLVEKAGASRSGSGSRADESDQEADRKVTLETVVVTAKVEGFAATRLPTEIREIPQSVSVISQDILQQQNTHDFASAMNWATGVTTSKDTSKGNSYKIRGFDLSSYHVDGGAQLPLLSGGRYLDLTEYDHVEVLRGSDALFGGVGTPSGSVNLVRKLPQAEFAASTSVFAGSWNNYRVEGDATGPLSRDGSLRGRVVMAHDDQEYFYDVAQRKLTKLYGVLEYDLLSSTKLTLGASVEDQNSVMADQGLPRYSTGADPHLPRSTALAFPWNRATGNSVEAFAKLEHRFSETWKLNIDATRREQNVDSLEGSISSAINPVTDLMLGSPIAQRSDTTSTSTTLDLNVTGAFDWNGRRQELVAGMDCSRTSQSGDTIGLEVSGPRINPFDFDPGAYPEPTASAMPVIIGIGTESKQFGAYAALKLRPWDGLSIVAGARNNYMRTTSAVSAHIGTIPYLSMTSGTTDTGEVTPYAGVTYDLNKQYSVYASYANVFSSNGGNLRSNGRSLPAKDGVNREVGIKAAWRDGRLNGSLAAFKSDLNNVPISDPNAPPGLIAGMCCYIAGTQTSKGVEAELNGALTSVWQFSAGYTFNINRNESGATLSTRSPKHLLKLWTVYQLPGAWSDWNLGGGITAQTASYNRDTACPAFGPLGQCLAPSVPFRVTQGFYTVATLRLGYRISPNWQAAVNVNNLFDRRYYQTLSTITSGNWYGEPRNFMLTIRGSL